jgi:hypothetical protein
MRLAERRQFDAERLRQLDDLSSNGCVDTEAAKGDVPISSMIDKASLAMTRAALPQVTYSSCRVLDYGQRRFACWFLFNRLYQLFSLDLLRYCESRRAQFCSDAGCNQSCDSRTR